MALVPSAEGSPMTRLADEAFEPIYSNIENGLLKGTSSTNQATLPQGYRLIYIPTSIVGLELCDDDGGHRSGIGPQRRRVSHIPRHQGELSTPQEDVFAFSAPLKMMLHPGASFYFSSVAAVSVSGYLVKFTGA